MRVAKWGNSLAVRLPAAVVEALNLKDGDEVEIVAKEPRLLEACRKPTREELVSRFDSFRGWLPADFTFDREEANER